MDPVDAGPLREPDGWFLAERLERPIAWADRTGRVRLANRVAAPLFGWSPDRLAEEPVRLPTPDGAPEQVINLPTAAGNRLAVQLAWYPTRPAGWYVALDPIDPDWLTAEERARRIRWLSELALDAALAVDSSGRIREWNDRCEALFGYTYAEAVGQPFHSLLHPETTQGETWNFFQLFLAASGRDPRRLFLQRKEVRLRDKAGHIKPVEIVPHALAAPEQVGPDDIVMVTYCRDLTDHYARQRQLEEALENLRKSQQQLVQSEKMASLGVLTAGIAHEINNPVNFVAANVEPLRRDVEDILRVLEAFQAAAEGRLPLAEAVRTKEELDLDTAVAELKSLLDGMLEGSRRTLEIVRGLRQFTRLDEDAMKPTRLVDGLESTLALLTREYEGRVDIRRDYRPVPDVECHPGQINQVFMNLLTNALAAIDGPGTIDLRLWAEDDTVRVAVSDSGCGMTPEVLAHVFDPFFTTKPVGQGTGLGLSISYGIVERHRGRLLVESRPGQGSTFTLVLPRRQPAGPVSEGP
jgi:PAS domain S-box-containing protein